MGKEFGLIAIVREIGSGLNDRRQKLASILADSTVQTIVIEHQDRLARFGVAQLERVMATRSSWWILVSTTMTSCVT